MNDRLEVQNGKGNQFELRFSTQSATKARKTTMSQVSETAELLAMQRAERLLETGRYGYAGLSPDQSRARRGSGPQVFEEHRSRFALVHEIV